MTAIAGEAAEGAAEKFASGKGAKYYGGSKKKVGSPTGVPHPHKHKTQDPRSHKRTALGDHHEDQKWESFGGKKTSASSSRSRAPKKSPDATRASGKGKSEDSGVGGGRNPRVVAQDSVSPFPTRQQVQSSASDAATSGFGSTKHYRQILATEIVIGSIAIMMSAQSDDEKSFSDAISQEAAFLITFLVLAMVSSISPKVARIASGLGAVITLTLVLRMFSKGQFKNLTYLTNYLSTGNRITGAAKGADEAPPIPGADAGHRLEQ